jgi:hypothetical protein
MRCTQCEINILTGNFCAYCGSELQKHPKATCSCGYEFIAEIEKFCRMCGKKRGE